MNTELFEKILNRIKTDPETWCQRAWANECGTAFCFAGHVVADMGLAVKPGGAVHDESGSFVGVVSRTAAKALGITSQEGDWLFDADRTISDFEKVLSAGSVEAAIPEGYFDGEYCGSDADEGDDE